jgi:aryl-alcohol dehydrogenase-like predicted oxidoreductase
MFHREKVERQFKPLYRDFQLGLTTWSPLASGILTGKYNEGIPGGSRLDLEGYEWLRKQLEGEDGEAKLDKVRQLTALADDELDCTMAQLALAWCVANTDVSTVITGASRPEQVEQNMQALEVAHALTPDLMERIESILDTQPEPIPNWRHM